jgi:hypothetical protein
MMTLLYLGFLVTRLIYARSLPQEASRMAQGLAASAVFVRALQYWIVLAVEGLEKRAVFRSVLLLLAGVLVSVRLELVMRLVVYTVHWDLVAPEIFAEGWRRRQMGRVRSEVVWIGTKDTRMTLEVLDRA